LDTHAKSVQGKPILDILWCQSPWLHCSR
jgi:hypothetical protein